jgi:hypothetical protein
MADQTQHDIPQKPDSIPASEWNYRTIKELVEANTKEFFYAASLPLGTPVELEVIFEIEE